MSHQHDPRTVNSATTGAASSETTRAPRQTDAQASGDPPEEVVPGVWRIPVPLPFALRSVNIYLITDDQGNHTLVDCGLGASADADALNAGLARAGGLTIGDITALVLTHAHPDHIGLAGVVHAASGAPVYMLAREAERMFRVWGNGHTKVAAALEEHYRRHGAPDEVLATARASNAMIHRTLKLPASEAIVPIQPGERLTIGAHTYQAIWTPGHSDHHMCLLRQDGLLLVGDHILPTITPHIGYYPDSSPDPLGEYLGALDDIADVSTHLALPGHGRPFADLADRARTIHAHHVERAQRLCALVREHPSGAHAAALARALFGARLRTAEDLRFALLETLAHLEYACLRGVVVRDESDAVVRYRPA